MKRHLPLLFLGLIAAVFLALIGPRIRAHAGDSDSAGYLSAAKLLGEGVFFAQPRVPELPELEGITAQAYMPLGFRPIQGKGLVPTYPLGLPLLFLSSEAMFGREQGPLLVQGLHALLSCVLVYLLGRQVGLSVHASLFAQALFCATPLLHFNGVQVLSDLPACLWLLLATYAALRCREHSLWGLAVGLCFSLAFLIRPTNALAFPALCLALGLRPKALELTALGGFPGLVFWLLSNKAMYGAYLASGYEGLDVLFSSSYLLPTLVHYTTILPLVASPYIFLALGAPWLRLPIERKTLWILALLLVPSMLFYAFYRHTAETWWYLRFLLPSLPALLLLAVAVEDKLWGYFPSKAGRALRLSLQGAALLALVLWSKNRDVAGIGEGEGVYPESARLAQTLIPKDALIVCMQTSASLFYETDFTLLRYDWLEPERAPRLLEAAQRGSCHLYAVLFPFEVEEVTSKRLPGTWTEIGAVRHVRLFRLDP